MHEIIQRPYQTVVLGKRSVQTNIVLKRPNLENKKYKLAL